MVTEKENYYDLMCQLATRGRRTFFKEKQNDPRGSESLVFDPNELRYFTVNDGALSVIAKNGSNEPERRIPLDELTIVGFLDSAPQTSGRSKKTDYAAIATVGIDSGGCKYLLDVWIQRAAPTAQVTRIFDQHQIWNYTLFGIEGNCFQNLLMFPIEEERKRRKEQGMNWRLPIEEVTHVKNKETRLMSLEPIVSNGWLLFNRDLPEMFYQQIEEFPTSLHDDALDALESAVALSPNVTYICDSAERRHSVRALQHF